MDDHFRQRVGKPALLLIGLLVAIGVFAFSISRVLLAVPQTIATIAAVLVAGYVLLVASVVGKNRRMSSQALGAGLVIGLVAVIGAGVVAAQAGPRELHAWDDHGDEDHDGEEPGAPVAEPGIPEGAHVWVAVDIDFTDAPSEIPSGEVTIAIDNQGGITHDVTFEGADVHVEAEGGQQASATYDLTPGTYTYYCSVPGHRNAMSGEIVVN